MDNKLLPLKRYQKFHFDRMYLASKILPKNSVGAELGVWKGEYAKTLYHNVNPSKLYLIDAWKHFPIYYDTKNKKWYDPANLLPQEELDQYYQNVVEYFKNDKGVNIIRDFTKDAAKHIPDESLDWVYIDADHTYENCLLDLELYSKKVKPGGLVCGHDFSHREELIVFGVNQAVEEFVNKSPNFKFIGITSEEQFGSYIIKKLK